ncbi:MAG: transporter substrate-binding domain-containing protein, partial [Clostridia bacterium]|nr:transporter substrate-binding domain-containing protein [Clostridia bacterium]
MKTLRRLLILLSVLTVFIAPSSVYAEKTVYKAGILDDYNFYGNNISEYARDSVNEVFKYIGNAELSYAETGIVNGLNELNKGNFDFFCMVPWNDALSSYLDYTNEPVATGFLALFTSSQSDIYFEHFEKFNNMQIGLIKNSYFEKSLIDYSIQNNFTYTPVYYNSISELTTAVSTNAIDAIFIPVTARPTGMKLIAKCGSVDYYCAVKKGNAQTLSVLNTALDTLKSESPVYLYSSFTEHFKIPYFNTAALTESEYIAVDYQKSLRILVPDDNYPMAYYDTEKKAYSGAFIDIVEDVARSANLEVEYIPEEDDKLP